MGLGSIDCEFHIPNAQLSQGGPVCDTIQTLIVCISSSGQPCLSSRPFFNELGSTSCLCISSFNSDTFYSGQDMSVLVQNNSDCSSLASTAVVLRGSSSISVSSNSSFTLSKTSENFYIKISHSSTFMLGEL